MQYLRAVAVRIPSAPSFQTSTPRSFIFLPLLNSISSPLCFFLLLKIHPSHPPFTTTDTFPLPLSIYHLLCSSKQSCSPFHSIPPPLPFSFSYLFRCLSLASQRPRPPTRCVRGPFSSLCVCVKPDFHSSSPPVLAELMAKLWSSQVLFNGTTVITAPVVPGYRASGCIIQQPRVSAKTVDRTLPEAKGNDHLIASTLPRLLFLHPPPPPSLFSPIFLRWTERFFN